MIPTLLSWSGGKDCCLALHALRQGRTHRPVGLLTSVTAEDDRIATHGVRRALVERQAAALGLPLHPVALPAGATNAAYERKLAAALAAHRRAGVRAVVFGDLFLADIRAYRESLMARMGLDPLFPLWGRDTRALPGRFIAAGFRAIVASVDTRVLDAAFAGRAFDAAFLADLPPGIDPCGENGEFHSFVTDGPIFACPIAVRPGATRRDGVYAYRDLVPVS